MQQLYAVLTAFEGGGTRVLSSFGRAASVTVRSTASQSCPSALQTGQQAEQRQLQQQHQATALPAQRSRLQHHQLPSPSQQQQQQVDALPHSPQVPCNIQWRCHLGHIAQAFPSKQPHLHAANGLACPRAFSSSSSSNYAVDPQQSPQQQQQQPEAQEEVPHSPPRQSFAAIGNAQSQAHRQLDELLQALLHPMPRTASWNAQLSPFMLQVNEQLLLQPSAVLMSVVRALHVMRGVLQENGHVYIVENNQLLRPLVKTAALSCINPNVWFDHRTWAPGTLTNYASSRRLFKESHQPNRRLFAAKGYRPVNPLCPSPPPLATPLPRLSQDDKWLLYRRSGWPGYRQLLHQLMQAEDKMLSFKPAGSLNGVPSALQLMVFLDSTKNAVAIKEAYNKNIPTIAIVNTTKDMSQVTYPVLARDFSPGFAHFFLDWIIKVANAAPQVNTDAAKAS